LTSRKIKAAIPRTTPNIIFFSKIKKIETVKKTRLVQGRKKTGIVTGPSVSRFRGGGKELPAETRGEALPFLFLPDLAISSPRVKSEPEIINNPEHQKRQEEALNPETTILDSRARLLPVIQ
jgi:hypothetical protein